ncbi:unnamed protein product [Spirodela intermedia]|uniref:Phosphofructokinase domain-containing protein n=1 Tax=Spirodela intermedia TaxID=51605 RepID=A0A7I8JQE6_SPIIN|nr:unnamed protein product [Spirodela intermedia]CAA6671642.1 unnamed protein product [Spirodela intermedia]
MEYLPSKVALPQKFRAECQSNGAVGNHLPDLRSSLSPSSSVKVPPTPSRNGEVKLVSKRGMDLEGKPFAKIIQGNGGYVLEDVPHLTDYIDDLPKYPNPLQDNPAYSVVKQYFVNMMIPSLKSPRGTHFRRAGPRQKVYFLAWTVACLHCTCGGLCPGLNTVIREIVCGLSHMYGRGTVLGTSRGGQDTTKIVDSIQDRRINQVSLRSMRTFISIFMVQCILLGGWNTEGASVIFEEIVRRGLKVSVVGIPKTIDNDIAVLGFDTAVEEAESGENGIGVVKLMGRNSGFIAMYATLASRDDCCLIPESPFYLEGPGGLFEFIERCLKEHGHMVIVVAEGAGQELIAETMRSANSKDPSGNKLLLDVGLWLSQKIKDHFAKKPKMVINLKYIDPTYMIRAVPSNASDNVYCTLLAQSAVHGAMAGYTGFTVGPVNGRHAYIPFYRTTETQRKVVITDRMWARLLSSTNQPSFLSHEHVEDEDEDDGMHDNSSQLADGAERGAAENGNI